MRTLYLLLLLALLLAGCSTSRTTLVVRGEVDDVQFELQHELR